MLAATKPLTQGPSVTAESADTSYLKCSITQWLTNTTHATVVVNFRQEAKLSLG